MKKNLYIHTNNKQFIGAQVAKYAVERNPAHHDIKVHYINVDELQPFKQFAGVSYLRGGKLVTYDPQDLQSFTLSRFMPPQLSGYEGRAIVIDPDIFALDNIQPLFELDLQGASIAACHKKDAWDTSVMLMDCAKLHKWNMQSILDRLRNKNLDYTDQMSLKNQPDGSIKEIPRIWNNLDTLTPDTKSLHTTDRLTQPWKTGLSIDFTRSSPGTYFGIIPKKPFLKLRGKWPSTYQKHPNPKIDKAFFILLKGAIENGYVSQADVDNAIAKGYVRKDIRACLEGL